MDLGGSGQSPGSWVQNSFIGPKRSGAKVGSGANLAKRIVEGKKRKCGGVGTLNYPALIQRLAAEDDGEVQGATTSSRGGDDSL